MSVEETEAARLQWAAAIEAVNQYGEQLQKATDAGLGETMISSLTAKVEELTQAAEVAYAAYGEAMKTWIEDAPRRWDYVVAASTATADGDRMPAISFGFRGGTEPPVTVTVIMTELAWRRFQKDVDSKITEAIREARKGRG